MTARDGALALRWRRRLLERHLARCAACRAEQASVEAVLKAVERLPREVEVPARLEDAVLRRVRALATDEAGGGLRVALAWLQRLAPTVAATAMVALAVIGVRSSEQGPRPPGLVQAAPAPHPVVVRRGTVHPPDDPPPALASRPELFVDLPLLRDLDKLRHYDAIAAMDDGNPGAPTGDGPPSG